MTKVTRLTFDEESGLDRRRIHLREISTDLDAPLDTIGQDLRAARLRRGDDLATVSRVLKIRKEHLEALEEDRIAALPGRTYAVGFVRSYADYLGLDSVQCIERFKAEIAGRSEEPPPSITVIEEDETRRMPQGWKIIAGVVLALVLYGAYQLAASADRMLSEPATEAPPGQGTQASATHIAVRPNPAPMQVTVTQPSAAPVAVSPSPVGQANQAPAASQGSPASLSPSGAVSTATAPVAATKGAPALPVTQNQQAQVAPAALPPLPPGQVYGEQNKTARVVLRVREATRVLVEGPNGTVYINRTLKPGDTYRVPNLVGMKLTTSNAGAVELDLDGVSMGLLGHNQETAEALSLDPQAVMDRHGRGG